MNKKKNFRELSLEEKIDKKNELLKQMREHRFTSVIGKVQSPMLRRQLRSSIACLNTLIHEQSKGS